VTSRPNRGLDLANVAGVTEDERKDFEAFYTGLLGHPHRGAEFFLEHDPETFKRYRRYSDEATPANYEANTKLFVFGFLPFYAVTGYDVGVRYLLHTRQKLGMTKAMILEGIAIAFLVMGPRGGETVARALEDYEWMEPQEPPQFPEGWAADPDAFRSGLDFEDAELSGEEEQGLRRWYLDTLGELPPHVEFLLRERPRMIKAYRGRFEHCLKILPKQFMPTTLLHWHVTRGFAAGIRENLLLARAFGVQKEIVLNTIGSASLQGVETIAVVEQVGAEIFSDWR
jgi:hypothetical protein